MAPVQFGAQHRDGSDVLPRHRHADAYVSLVIEGFYEEAGDAGRFHVSAGDVLLHSAFEAHLNRCGPRGAEILSFRLPPRVQPAGVWMRTANPDAVLRLAERDVVEATALLLSSLSPIGEASGDWPEALAVAIRGDPALRIGEWARSHGLADETVSRGFKQVFGVSPQTFRAQARGRLAWRELIEGHDPLVAVAANTGFSDQAHMTRIVLAVTGRTPGAWRQEGQLHSKQRGNWHL